MRSVRWGLFDILTPKSQTLENPPSEEMIQNVTNSSTFLSPLNLPMLLCWDSYLLDSQTEYNSRVVVETVKKKIEREENGWRCAAVSARRVVSQQVPVPTCSAESHLYLPSPPLFPFSLPFFAYLSPAYHKEEVERKKVSPSTPQFGSGRRSGVLLYVCKSTCCRDSELRSAPLFLSVVFAGRVFEFQFKDLGGKRAVILKFFCVRCAVFSQTDWKRNESCYLFFSGRTDGLMCMCCCEQDLSIPSNYKPFAGTYLPAAANIFPKKK